MIKIIRRLLELSNGDKRFEKKNTNIYSTVTDFAKFLGLSISYPFSRAE